MRPLVPAVLTELSVLSAVLSGGNVDPRPHGVFCPRRVCVAGFTNINFSLQHDRLISGAESYVSFSPYSEAVFLPQDPGRGGQQSRPQLTSLVRSSVAAVFLNPSLFGSLISPLGPRARYLA